MSYNDKQPIKLVNKTSQMKLVIKNQPNDLQWNSYDEQCLKVNN